MYNGWTETQEQIDARKRRILADYKPFIDDGNGANLLDYSREDIQHDYNAMKRDFGEDDPDVKNYKRALDTLKNL